MHKKHDEIIEKANVRFEGKFDYSKSVFERVKDKCIIICPEHGEFLQSISVHLKSIHGCQKCSHLLQIGSSRKLRNDEWVIKFKEKHRDRYIYHLDTINGRHGTMKVTCREHGAFYPTPGNFLKSSGCKKCASIRGGRSIRLSESDFLIRAEKAFKNIYSYPDLSFNTVHDKVDILCNTHGIFSQKVYQFLNGKGCPVCSRKARGVRSRTDPIKVLDEMMKVHKNKYSYPNFKYNGRKSKIDILCKIHGIFKQTPNHHIFSAAGCPKCKSSKGEVVIRETLRMLEVKSVEQKRFGKCRDKYPLPFDFYLPDYNLLIEYSGIQHYCPVEFFGGEAALAGVQRRDKIKYKYGINNDFNYLVIPYTEFNDIEDILLDTLTLLD